ncbi:hypothetical protein pb186bvf_019153 [Paramecium bursaria]
MSLKDFRIINKLGIQFYFQRKQQGEGAYSQVYKVKRCEDNFEYALKKVNLNNLSDKEKQNALNEVRILASIRHPNIISYKEAFIDANTNHLCIIMELADNGDLLQKIQKYQKNNASFKETEIMRTALQMASALKALHEMKIFHRDLKSANVFLQQNGDVKLGDMNVSKVAKKGLLYTQTGTPYYASPEVWKDLPYDQKSDVWSLGCVLYEMACLRPPFKAEDMDGLYKKVIRGLYPKIPQQYSMELSTVIRMMLQVSTTLRPTSAAILELPYFQKYKSHSDIEIYNNKLLGTIIFPKNMSQLNNCLPKPNYSNSKHKTESHQILDSDPRKRNYTSLLSQQGSPIPLSQDMDVSRMHPMKRVNLNDKNVIQRLLADYQRELLKVESSSRPNLKVRRVSQEEIGRRRGPSQLPMLENSPSKQFPLRQIRNASMPNTNLPNL